LTVTTEDAGAVEVLFSGTSAGFVGGDGQVVDKAPLAQLASLAPRPPIEPAPTVTTPEASAPALTQEQAEAVRRGLAALEEDLRQEEAPEVTPTPPVEQEIASVQAPEPPVQQLPEPPLPSVQVTPVVAYVPVPQQFVLPPAAEPDARRPLIPLLGRLFGNRAAEPNPDSVILAPAISKEAVDRQQAAADQAKAANEAAREKARADARAREGAFFNSTLGINSRY
jgi:hypothetical protein